VEAMALNTLTPKTLASVLGDVREKKQAREIVGSGCIIAPKEWEKQIEDYYDLQLGLEALKREAKPSGKGYTHEEVMQMLGISQADLDAVAGDEEIE